MLALAATAVCAVAVLLLVRAERDGDGAGRFRWKPLASAAFLVVPVVGGALGEGSADPTLARWVVAGLCLGALGDLALLFDDSRSFLAGLVAFLLGHVAYVVAFATVIGVGQWTGGAMPVAIGAAALAAIVVVRWLWPDLGSMRGPVLAYVAVISAMIVGGAAASLRGDGAAADGTTRGLLTAGAVGFYLSDLAVAREKFKGRDPRNRMVGLPIYYGAQLLFAWAVVPR